MSCSLTTGYALGCRNSVGGIKKIWLKNFNATGSVTVSGGLVTALPSASVSGWFQYDLTKATASLTETLNVSVENGTTFYTPELTFSINKLQKLVRNELLLMSKARLWAIFLDNNDTYWMLGVINGLDATAGTNGTGTAFGDRSGYSITLSGMEPDPMPEMDVLKFAASAVQISG